MDTTTINGLHSCKPGNDPVVGQIKTFVVQQLTGKSGKPYLKIKSKSVEDGGTPHRILSVERSLKPDGTPYTDQYGNSSYNLEIEATAMQPSAFQQTKAAMQDADPHGQHGEVDGPPHTAYNATQSPPARQNHDSGPMSKDDYWRRKEDRDEQRQRLIVRQHSQSMAIEVLKLKVTLNELTVEDITPSKLKQLGDFFDNDVIGATNGN